VRHARAGGHGFGIEQNGKRPKIAALPLLGDAQLLFGAQQLGIGLQIGVEQRCSASALRWISRVLRNRSTNTATLDWITIGSTGLNT
jgi:hypothetical protein